MSVRCGKTGKSSHEQKAVRVTGGFSAGTGVVRGAAGGLLNVGKSGRTRKPLRPAFEHLAKRGRKKR